MISNPRHGSPPRLMAHQPTRCSTTQESSIRVHRPDPVLLREHFSIRPSPNRACAFRSTRLSSVPPRADDPQDGFGASHLAYLPARVSGHLPPFPVWTAFPPSEYYGGSVTLRLAARRAIPHSHGAGRVERDVGASFAPLNGMRSHRPPRGRFERRRRCRPIAVAPP